MLNYALIRSRREALKLSLADAAALAGMPRAQWWDIESGRKKDPRISTLAKVAKVLRCKVDALLEKKP